MINVNSFKPKSIEELNAAFEQKLTEIKQEREKELAQDDILSEEQKEFYRVNDDEPDQNEVEVEPEETEIQPEEIDEEAENIPEEEEASQENEDVSEDIIEEESEETEEAEEMQEAVEEDYTNNEEPEEVNELFEAERLAQEQAELYEANFLDNKENAENEPDEQADETAEDEADIEETAEEAAEEEKAEEKEKTPVFYFKENAQDLKEEESDTTTELVKDVQPVFVPKKEFEEVKLTKTKDVRAEKRNNKKNNEEKSHKSHKAAKTILNTIISLVIIACVIINGFVFMADMPKRFIVDTGVTVCEQAVEGSNIKSGSLLFTKRANTAEDNNIVAAITRDKNVIVDFKQNIPEDAEIYSKTVKLVPKVGGAIKLVRNYWFESGLIELALLLVVLIARVAVSDKKEKHVIKKKSN